MDNLFKALLIIILGAFLYLYYENSNNDRYSHIPTEAGKPIPSVILDKKTGIFYFKYSDGYMKTNILELKDNTDLFNKQKPKGN